MSRNEIFEKIKSIFDDFFDGEITVDMDTTMENTELWESVSHIQLIFEIEEEFAIQFEAEEIVELNSIKKIINAIERKNKNAIEGDK